MKSREKEIKSTIDFNKIDLETLTEEKVKHIYDNSVNLLREQRETFDTHYRKATTILTASVAIIATVLTIITTSKTGVYYLPFIISVSIEIIIIFLLLSILIPHSMAYSYAPPETYFGEKKWYKYKLIEILLAEIIENQRYIEEHMVMMKKNAYKLIWSIILFFIAPILGLVIYVFY